MLEIFLFFLIIGAYILGHNLGCKEGKDQALSRQKAMVYEGMAPNSAFHRVYGVPGFYLSDTSEMLQGLPLITVSSANFLGLIAKIRFPEGSSPEEIEKMKHSLVRKYLLETGMSAEKIDAIEEVHNNLQRT